MTEAYLGTLPIQDPLHGYLQADIFSRLGEVPDSSDYHVFRLGGSRGVYRYEDTATGSQVVGKFYHEEGQRDAHEAVWRMESEFRNLEMLREFGLIGYPHHVIRPLGCNASLGCVLVLECGHGRLLSDVIDDAVYRGEHETLYDKLGALAFFLAECHNRTATAVEVDFWRDCHYLDKLVLQLRALQFLGEDEASDFFWLRDRWSERPTMWGARQVVVHGDATPANFLLGPGLQVTAIDLERMQRGDRTADIGRVAGELHHAFLQGGSDAEAAGRFIGHFLWEYSGHLPEQQAAFDSLTGRFHFQMALTLLRIARNPWVSGSHRWRLLAEARGILGQF